MCSSTKCNLPDRRAIENNGIRNQHQKIHFETILIYFFLLILTSILSLTSMSINIKIRQCNKEIQAVQIQGDCGEKNSSNQLISGTSVKPSCRFQNILVTILGMFYSWFYTCCPSILDLKLDRLCHIGHNLCRFYVKHTKKGYKSILKSLYKMVYH